MTTDIITRASESRKKQIAFSYLGGKYYHLDWLLPLLECVNAYSFVDLFAGSFAVTLNIRPHRIMTANDINGEVVNFFMVLRDQPDELVHLLQLTPYSREEYKNARIDLSLPDIERARRFFVRAMQSKFSMGAQNHNKGWATITRDSRANLSEYISKNLNKVKNLKMLVQSLKLIQIENRDFRNVIKNYASPNTLIYADPPYPHESRTNDKDYAFEMSNEDHCELSAELHNTDAFVAVSGYDCELMNSLYGDWFLHKAPVSKRNISKSDRQECLWTNYNPKTVNRLTLF
ncbi:DNA adenine methylase [Arcticibacter tournemirensis]|nr:DNA adenine methylase [Arcticibacter tournemirensis]